jgi:TIR domain-containing protein
MEEAAARRRHRAHGMAVDMRMDDALGVSPVVGSPLRATASRATMSDVFLAFAREDRVRAETVARALTEQGLSVRWDHLVPAGSSWKGVIGEAFEAAAAVVVLWSAHSVRSEWVIAEADAGRNARKLILILPGLSAYPLW